MSGPAPAASAAVPFVVGAAGLYLELLLIRWVSTEVRVFAYLQNTVLVVCFLALGVGCWTCRRPARPGDALGPLLALVLALIPISYLSLGSQISMMLNPFGDLLIFSELVTTDPARLAAYFALAAAFAFVLLAAVWEVFVPLGRVLGRTLADHPHPIRAYSANVAGSLAGTALFVAASGLWLPPVAWVAVGVGLVLALARLTGTLGRADLLLSAGLVAAAAFAGGERGALEVRWSPYQKLSVRPAPAGGRGEYVVSVNNAGGFQEMIDLRDATTAADPARFPPDLRGLSQYDLPSVLHPDPNRVLIVGAGSGTGVASAVRHGAAEVVAVEIDPVILDYGKRYHPAGPYQSPAVRVVNDDARAYFANSADRFDVVSMEFLDSHTTTAMTNARLDHYVYTRESFAQAKRLLADGGVLVLLFGHERAFVADRMNRGLREVFGQEPIVIPIPNSNYGPGGTAFVVGDLAAVRKQIAADPRLAGLIDKWRAAHPPDLPGTTEVATDDWPYIYLPDRRVPVLYGVLGLVLAGLFARGWWQLPAADRRVSWGRAGWHFFFLGAGFLLLEVQNVSKAAVLLGSTWQVNAVVVGGVLGLALVANAVAAALPRLPLGPVYVALVGSCGGLYFLDLGRFAGEPYAVRVAVVGGLTCLPVLFSGIVFVRSFAASRRRDAALAANLIGALAGGVLQSVTFVTGVQALLLIVAGLYAAAWATRPDTAAVADVPAPPAAEPTAAPVGATA